ncbi:MAG: ATP synthase subunit I [Geobacteraceae bacterium]|nr:ATP synthase subunit I [Geobacteraceae bacterium]
MISIISKFSIAALAGLLLGLFYFGGLCLTVRAITCGKRPEMLMLASFVLRLLVALSGFYLVMDGSSGRLIACLSGFLLMRYVLTKAVKQGEPAVQLPDESARARWN